MSPAGADRDANGQAGKPAREPFGNFAEQALRARLPESRAHDATWWSGPNLTWVRWQRDDGCYLFCAIRRRRDWLTGEMGIAAEPLELDALHAVTRPDELTLAGSRIALGWLTNGHEKWWTTGGHERGFLERLDWLSHQLRLRLPTLARARDIRRAA